MTSEVDPWEVQRAVIEDLPKVRRRGWLARFFCNHRWVANGSVCIGVVESFVCHRWTMRDPGYAARCMKCGETAMISEDLRVRPLPKEKVPKVKWIRTPRGFPTPPKGITGVVTPEGRFHETPRARGEHP